MQRFTKTQIFAAVVCAAGLVACNTSCPHGYVEQGGICHHITEDAGTNDVQPTAQTSSSVSESAGAGKVSKATKEEGGTGLGGSGVSIGMQTASGTGGASGHSSDTSTGSMVSQQPDAGMSTLTCTTGMSCGTKCGECCVSGDCTEKQGYVTACNDQLKCTYACPSGSHDCNGKCIPMTNCCDDTDCPMKNSQVGKCDTSSQQCGYSCAGDTKPCGGQCIPSGNCCNDQSCMYGLACVSGACSTTQCASGLVLCDSKCIAWGACCSDSDCMDHFACGAGAVCSKTVCTTNYKNCGGKCIPKSACCTDSECGNYQCISGTCSTSECQSQYQSCNGKCIGQTACCGDSSCGGNHACVNNACSTTQCTGGYRACNGNCVTQTNGCCNDDECAGGVTCTDGKCSTTCRDGYVTCSNGGCVQNQDACVAVTYTNPPGSDCNPNVCIPQNQVCKTDKFRRVFVPTTDPSVAASMCASKFEAMRQSICAESDVAGHSDVVVHYVVDEYTAAGGWKSNSEQGTGTCAN